MTTDRSRARQLAEHAARAGEPLAWFERLYAEATEGRAVVPWADRVPNAHLVRWLEDNPAREPQRVLDVGCGFGDNAEELARRGHAVTAFDIAASAIAEARRRFPDSKVDYGVGNLLDVPAEWHGAFDLVVEIYTLQTLPPPERALAIRTLRSLVADGGVLLVIARAREESEPPGNLPWPLTRKEMEAIGDGGLTLEGWSDFVDDEEPPIRRFLATFRKNR